MTERVMEELRVGSVVYLRGDVVFETPLTVAAESHTKDHYELVWLSSDKLMQETHLPRAALMTAAEAYADEIEREDLKRLEREKWSARNAARR